MSNDVFPTLDGRTWDLEKNPEFSTAVQRSVNLTELRASYADQPVWHFKLSYDVLRQDGSTYNELNSLAGFFLAHYGKWDSWLYAADDSVVSNQSFGTGNGSATVFQLSRTIGAFNIATAGAIATAAAAVASTASTSGMSGFGGGGFSGGGAGGGGGGSW